MSAAPKFTPGPWAVTGISMNTGSISVGQRDQRIVIAEVTNAASFGDMLGGAMRRGGGGFQQSDCTTQHANARLIAAAPDLLDALKAMVLNDKHTYRDCHKAALAAIAKAEGRANLADATPNPPSMEGR